MTSGFPQARVAARVLVVDDELALVRAYARSLAAAGYEVETATDVEQARRLLAAATFDVVVSDISMPRADGFEVLRAARRADPDLSVVLVTGAPRDDDALEAAEAGALVYLVKPVDLGSLAQVVQNGVRLTRLGRLHRVARAEASAARADAAHRELGLALDRALAGMFMAYQPIVRRSVGRAFAFEALLRSREPALPTPGALLEAAERLERLDDVGRRVRALVAADAPSVPEGALLFVNLHPRDLEDDELLSPAAPLSAVAPRVVLEVTERASVVGLRRLESRLGALRALGYRIAIDDFGEGYAGLASVVKLRPDVVKLDMSIVRDIHLSEAKQTLVAEMVATSADTRVTLVGEGIETALERDALSALGCDLHQGYLYAKPGALDGRVEF